MITKKMIKESKKIIKCPSCKQKIIPLFEKNKLKHIDKDLIIKVCNISKVTIDKIYAKIIMWSNFLSDFNEN